MLVANGATAVGAAVWKQTVTAVPGVVYRFSVWVANLVAGEPAPQLGLYINGVGVGSPLRLRSQSVGRWTELSATWLAGESGLAALEIRDLETAAGGNDFALDDITLSEKLPGIISQPLDVIASLGETVSISVMPFGAEPLTYQWRKNGVALPNQTGATLVLENVDLSATGGYSVVLQNSFGTYVSAPVSLRFQPTTVVMFADPNLERSVRTVLGKSEGSVTVGDMEGMTSLMSHLTTAGIQNLGGLESAVNLVELNLSHNRIVDLSPLGGMTQLKFLSIENNLVTDLGPIANCVALDNLLLSHNRLGSLVPIAGLTRMTSLVINHTGLTDYSLVNAENFPDLTAFHCMGNGLGSLEFLGAISPTLADLSVRSNPVGSLAGLERLVNLASLDISYTWVSNVAVLKNTTFPRLTTLHMQSMELKEVGFVADLPLLETLNVSWNPIVDVGPIGGMTHLLTLDIRGCWLSDLAGLVGLPALTYFACEYNYLDITEGSAARVVIQQLTAPGGTAVFDPQQALPPRLDGLFPRYAFAGQPLAPFAFVVGDPARFGQLASLLAASSNQAVVRDVDIVIRGSGLVRSLEIRTAAGATGVADITLTASYAGGAPVSGSFRLTCDAGRGVARDQIGNAGLVLLGGADYTNPGLGRSGSEGDHALDFGYGLGRTGATTAETRFLNAASAGDTISISVWQKLREVSDSTLLSGMLPGDRNGVLAHVPWSDGTVYFDTAGCCNPETQRIGKHISLLPSYSGNGTWWNTWHHLVLSKQGATKRIYIDGVLFHEGSNTEPLPLDFRTFWLGSHDGQSFAAPHGMVDDLAVFNEALSAEQVLGLAQGASPTTIGGLAAFWDFNDAPLLPKVPVLGVPFVLETFDAVPEGELPAGWTANHHTDVDLAGQDLNEPRSDSYLGWLSLSRQRVLEIGAAGKWSAERRLRIAPNQYQGNVLLTNLVEGRFLYAESDIRFGNQVQYLFSPDFDLTGKANVYLSYRSIYEQNQDSIGSVEYSIDGGSTWLPVVYMIDGQDVVRGLDGSIDASATLGRTYPDVAHYTDAVTGSAVGGNYGAFIGVKPEHWSTLAPYISSRVNDDPVESKRLETFRLPAADGQARVRFRFGQAGTTSWYFGIDNFALYAGASEVVASPVADPGLAQAIREELRITDRPLVSADLRALTRLGIVTRGVKSLAGLENAVNLTFLDLSVDGGVPLDAPERRLDLSVLANLPQLEWLNVTGQALTSIEFLRGLPGLRTLGMDNTPNVMSIADYSPLASATSLVEVNMQAHPLGTAAVFKDLKQLTTLVLNWGQVTHADDLATLPKLKVLHLYNVGLGSISFLEGMRQLEVLSLGQAGVSPVPVTALSVLQGLTNVTWLTLDGRAITSADQIVPYLRHLPRLTSLSLENVPLQDGTGLALLAPLQYLNLNNTSLRGLEFARGMSELRNLGLHNGNRTMRIPSADWGVISTLTSLVSLTAGMHDFRRLDFLGSNGALQNLAVDNSQVTDLGPLVANSQLVTLSAAFGVITDLRPLLELPNLRYVNVSGNPIVPASVTGADVLAGLGARGVAVLGTVLPEPVSLPLTGKLASASGLMRGFRGRIHESQTAGLENTLLRAESQLAGLLGASVVPVDFVEGGAVNYDNDGQGLGHFVRDINFPNLPGFARDNLAASLTGYVELKAGYYVMGVTSDDGFAVSSGFDPLYTPTGNGSVLALNPSANILSSFDGGRGTSDTTWVIRVPEDGFYPMRLLWEEGGGAATLEWWIVDLQQPSGTRQIVLVNDLTEASSPAAYSPAPTSVSAPSVRVDSLPILEVGSLAVSTVPFWVVDSETSSREILSTMSVTVTSLTPSIFPSGSFALQRRPDGLFLSLLPENASAGVARVLVTATDAGGLTGSAEVSITLVDPAHAIGYLRREVYRDIVGSDVASLRQSPNYPGQPTQVDLVSKAESMNLGDNYGQRLSGYLLPPLTGDYSFYLAGDDGAELWLSTDNTPANQVRIALEPIWAGYRAYQDPFNRNPSAPENRSVPIRLNAGLAYYFEVVHKDGCCGDSVSVAWQMPGEPPPANGSEPIAGRYFSAYAPSVIPPAFGAKLESRAVIAGQSLTLTAMPVGGLPMTLEWRRNGVVLNDDDNVVGSRTASLLIRRFLPGMNGVYSLVARNAVGEAMSSEAQVTAIIGDQIPVLPAGSPWEYTFVNPTLDTGWATSTGGWTVGSAPFGNDSTGPFAYRTLWPADSTSEDDLWIRTTVDLTGLDPALARWNLSVDNGYKLYVNGNLIAGANEDGGAFRWEYTGALTGAISGVNHIALALEDHGGGTAFDMEVVANSRRDPEIAAPVGDQLVDAGADVIFTVQASGTGPFTYQWKRNGLDLVGQTGSVLSIPKVTMEDTGDYSVAVFNAIGSAVSGGGRLRVRPTGITAVGGLGFLGSAAIVNGNIRLTPAVVEQAGAVWLETLQPIATGFDTTFQFQIRDPLPLAADGFAFVIQSDGVGVLGGGGAGLGYSGMFNSLAIEFDTWDNGLGIDPNANHISVQTRGGIGLDQSLAHTGTTLGVDLKDGLVHTARISYQGTTLRVFVDNLVQPLLAVEIGNMDTYVPLRNGAAWVGFTAATASGAEVHDILSWTFRNGAPSVPRIVVEPGLQAVFRGQTASLVVDAPGYPIYYQWSKGPSPLANIDRVSGATSRNLRIAQAGAGDAGEYTVRVSNNIGFVDSAPSQLVIHSAAAPAGIGQAMREIYPDIPGTAISDLRASPAFPDRPSVLEPVSSLEVGSYGENYGQRISGLLWPPVTGEYRFYMASDDGGEFYLSTDELPAHAVKIASEPSWAVFRDFQGLDRRNPTQPENRSAAISLEAGRGYYFEALMKEGGGGDHLSVAWQLPGGQPPVNGAEPISGAYLSPITRPLVKPLIVAPPVSSTFAVGQSETISVGVVGLELTYRWLKSGVQIQDSDRIFGSRSAVLTFRPFVAEDAGDYTVVVENSAGSTESLPVTLTARGNADFTQLPVASRVTPDTGKAGFSAFTYQVGVGQVDTLHRAERQILGQLKDSQGAVLPNVANLTGAGLSGRFDVPGVVNFGDITGGFMGRFGSDDAIPGLPGQLGHFNDVAMEVITYLDLPQGVVRMGVNSDDGFEVSAGVIKDLFDRTILGRVDGVSGSSSRIFDFYVPEAGVYPFRVLWEQGQGAAGLEWFTVKPDGTAVLVNDTANGGYRAYREIMTTEPRVSVAVVEPDRGAREVKLTEPIRITLLDPGVGLQSVHMQVQGVTVVPTITVEGGRVTMVYTPSALYPPDTDIPVRLSFRETTGAVHDVQWSFHSSVLALNSLFIEAEDFDFGKGQRVQNTPIGMTGPYAGGAYQNRGTGLLGVAGDGSDYGIDYFEAASDNLSPVYRPQTGVEVNERTLIPMRASRGTFEVQVAYQVGWNDAGDWYNYTREFPRQSRQYRVFASLSSGGAPISAELGRVVSGVGTTQQTVETLGWFIPGRSTGGYDNMELFELTDTSGSPVHVTLGGTNTIRFTTLPGNLDVDYLAFVPISGTEIEPPTITLPPVPVTVFVGGEVRLSVQASGPGPLQYQWRKGVSNIQGATAASYTIPRAGLGDAGDYSVVVSNAGGETTSTAAVLQVKEFTGVPVELRVGQVSGGSGSTFSVPVRVRGFTGVSSVQFSMHWDPAVASFVSVSGFGLDGLAVGSFNLTQAGSGFLTLSWDDLSGIGRTLADDSMVFQLDLHVHAGPGVSSVVNLDGSPTPAEVSNVAGDVIPYLLTGGGITVLSTVELAGVTRYYANANLLVAGVEVGVTGGSSVSTVTSVGGAYSFLLNAGQDYNVTATKTSDVPAAQGVTTLDITLVRRQILGIAQLDSPYKILAADVNRSGNVSTLDITLMRRVILGITNNFPGGAWLFVPSSVTFGNPSAPWGYDPVRRYTGLTTPASGQDFIGVKLGDVNGSWTPVTTAPPPPSSLDLNIDSGRDVSLVLPNLKPPVDKGVGQQGLQLSVDTVSAGVGEEFNVPVRVSGGERLRSLQFSLGWNPAVLQLVRVGSYGVRGLGEGNLNLQASTMGRLSLSWDDPEGQGIVPGVGPGMEWMRLTFRSRSAKPSAGVVRFVASPTPVEAVVGDAAVPTNARDGWIWMGRAASEATLVWPGLGAGSAVNSLQVPTWEGLKSVIETTADLMNVPWREVQTFEGDGTTKAFPVVTTEGGQSYYRVRFEP